MPGPFRTQRRVEFRDTDAAGIMHFSAFFVLMEQAEHELLRHCGLSVVERDDHGEIGWPRVSAACDFLSPARFEQLLDIGVSIRRLGTKSITYGFSFACEGQEIASGSMTSVCCRFEVGQPPQSIAIPMRFIDRLREYLETSAE